MDIRNLLFQESLSLIVENAVFGRLSDESLEQGIASIVNALHPGGYFLAFDWFHPFEQHLTIIERSVDHPEGLELYMRPFSLISRLLEENDFDMIDFRPFNIPIDLEFSSYQSINTYTRQEVNRNRLSFRGTLYQPWCHLIARKKIDQ